MQTIERFMDWLKRQKFWKAFLLSWAFIFVWNFIVGITLYSLGAKFSQHVAPTESFLFNWFLPFTLVVLTALLEEMIFRWGPLFILSIVLTWMHRTGRLTEESFYNVEKYAILIIAVISGIVFGWVHGTAWNILIQGVDGTVFLLIYLRIFFIRRDKGLRNRWQLVPLAESTLLHTVSNIILMIL